MKPIFTGAATALITPMKDEAVDYEAFSRLIDWQIESGIDGLVVAGTTGENPTLTDDEQKELIKFCIDHADGRVPVIAGTGTYDTAHSIELSRFACEAGASAVLLVTPYYNKATQAGLIAHFTAIAEAIECPCVLYNVPGRTGCNIAAETCAELAYHPQIAAVKEASGDLSQVAKIASLCGDCESEQRRADSGIANENSNDFAIYSGNDDQIVPIMSLGGLGVISVLSNIMPAKTSEMAHACLDGDYERARALQLKLLPLINTLFCEVNPIPVKAACELMGYGDGSLRLPLTRMSVDNLEILKHLMKEQSLL